MKGIDLLLALAAHDDRVLELLRAAAFDGDFYEAAGLGRAARTRARDEALRDAAEILSADECGPWIAVGRLVASIQRFKSLILPRLRPGIMVELCPVDTVLHRAWLTGRRLPESESYLYELLK